MHAFGDPMGLRISIHAPVKGATPSCMTASIVVTNFNPRSREGSDMGHQAHHLHEPISIHAPVKGATYHDTDGRGMMTYFNPRSREGSDCNRRTSHSHHPHFNPRSREGSDQNAFAVAAATVEFQSTLP